MQGDLGKSRADHRAKTSQFHAFGLGAKPLTVSGTVSLTVPGTLRLVDGCRTVRTGQGGTMRYSLVGSNSSGIPLGVCLARANSAINHSNSRYCRCGKCRSSYGNAVIPTLVGVHV